MSFRDLGVAVVVVVVVVRLLGLLVVVVEVVEVLRVLIGATVVLVEDFFLLRSVLDRLVDLLRLAKTFSDSFELDVRRTDLKDEDDDRAIIGDLVVVLMVVEILDRDEVISEQQDSRERDEDDLEEDESLADEDDERTA